MTARILLFTICFAIQINSFATQPDFDSACFAPLNRFVTASMDNLWLVTEFPPKVTRDRNNALLKDMIANTPFMSHPNNLEGISKETAQLIYDNVAQNPVAGLGALKKYDPNCENGFCFGRAVAVNMEAAQRGVDQNRVLKLWVIGDLKPHQRADLKLWDYVERNEQGEWGFHVTTIIKSDKKGWWAIDPVFDKPLTERQWYNSMLEMTPDRNAILIVTNADRFSLDRSSIEHAIGLSDNNYYNGYFMDLFKYYWTKSKHP
ncbi:MAG: hypothetical protein ISR65_05375 [Bacteriovoracaceae bacterium]|nr:hypothetical protein [Bacteriovoracaceae bacterium]